MRRRRRGCLLGLSPSTKCGERTAVSRSPFVCSSKTEAFLGPAQVQISYLQTDGGHLPCDEFGLPILYLLCTIGAMGYAVLYFMQLQRHQSTTGQIHPVTACIGIVLLLQWLAMLFEQGHLWSLESSGKGSSFSNGVSHFLSWLATSFMTAVLVLIGYGWTITSDSLGHMLTSTLAGAGLATVYGIKALALTLSYLRVIDSVDHAMYHAYENRGGQFVAALQFGAPSRPPARPPHTRQRARRHAVLSVCCALQRSGVCFCTGALKSLSSGPMTTASCLS